MTNTPFYDVFRIILMLFACIVIFAYHWKHRDGPSFLIAFIIFIKMTIEILVLLDGRELNYVW